MASTYVLSFWNDAALYVWGLPAALEIPEIFTNPAGYVFSMPDWFGYVIGILVLLFAAAGVLQLIGLGSRPLGALGGLFALIGGAYFALVFLTGTAYLPSEAVIYVLLFFGSTMYSLPVHVAVGAGVSGGTIGVGTYLLIVGGLLGLVGSLMSKD